MSLREFILSESCLLKTAVKRKKATSPRGGSTTSPIPPFVSPCEIIVNDGRTRSYEIRRGSAEDQPKVRRTCLARGFGTRLIAEAGKTGPLIPTRPLTKTRVPLSTFHKGPAAPLSAGPLSWSQARDYRYGCAGGLAFSHSAMKTFRSSMSTLPSPQAYGPMS